MQIKWGEDLSGTTAPRVYSGITIIAEDNKIVAFKKGKRVVKVVRGNLLKAYATLGKR